MKKSFLSISPLDNADHDHVGISFVESERSSNKEQLF